MKQLDFCLFQTDNGIFFHGCCFHLEGDIGCPCGAQRTTETEFTSNVPLGFTGTELQSNVVPLTHFTEKQSTASREECNW